MHVYEPGLSAPHLSAHSQGTLFRLRFLLKRYVGTVFEIIQGATVISDPIEVFSHTLYLNTNRQDAPSPPVLNECLPTAGPCMGGTRIVLLGSNFVHSPELKVILAPARCVRRRSLAALLMLVYV